jgi:quercetin dioxygenase-like cupin family protein
MSFPETATAVSVPALAGRGFVLGPDQGHAQHWLGTLSITKVAGSDTGGRPDVVDHRVPAGYAPPRHIHSDADEVFYVLEGSLQVTCGDESWQVGPGDLVFLPRGVPHGFVAGSAGPARTLLINAPAGFGDLIFALGTATEGLELPGDDVPVPGPDQIGARSAEYGIHPAPADGNGR